LSYSKLKIQGEKMPFSVGFALTGVVQGWVLWWLWNARELKGWPSTEPVLWTALAYAALTVPLVIYCTHGISTLPAQVRRVAVVLFGALFAALGAYSAWAAGLTAADMHVRFTDVAVALVLGFVSLSLLCGFDFATRRWNYANLFNFTWRNGILIFTAWFMTGVVWVVLYAGASLMTLLEVKWILEMIKKEIFIFPVTGLVVAAAFSLGQARAGLTESIRRFWLSISAWLLPLVLFFALVWALTAPFTGLQFLFNTKHAAMLMLWFAALAVKFANCAYQDGESTQPYPAWLGRATQFAWLALLPVVAIAWWALYLRIAQYGLTEQRLWAALVAAMAAIYVVGYALSWLQPARWMHFMARTNIVAAVFLCLALIAFASPLAQVQRLAVDAHINRVTAANGTVEPDWKYLRWDAGRFGREALQEMAAGHGVPAGVAWAKQASATLAEVNRWGGGIQPLGESALAEKLKVHPPGRKLPAGFLAYFQTKEAAWQMQDCVRTAKLCDVWVGDLNGDEADEVVLFGSSGNGYGQAFRQTATGWQMLGHMNAEPAANIHIDSVQLDSAQIAPNQWQDLVVDGKRLRLK
jgi:hypothetical protein